MFWKKIGIIFIAGFLILIGAILINFLAKTIGLITWYDLLINFTNSGLKEISKVSFLSFIFLFVIYPYLLGLIGYLSIAFLKKIMK